MGWFLRTLGDLYVFCGFCMVLQWFLVVYSLMLVNGLTRKDLLGMMFYFFGTSFSTSKLGRKGESVGCFVDCLGEGNQRRARH